ncbi:MAG: MCP four helix bundle domain-containing protein [Nitrospirae bacterium]|nr:MCP four helix bundle domain-containing protein [Nitrospirota bacterium]
MKISLKLGLGFGFVLLLLLVTGAIGHWGLELVHDTVGKALGTDVNVAVHSAMLKADVLTLRRYEKDVFINIANAKKVESYFNKWNEAKGTVAERIANIEKASTPQKDKDVVAAIKADFNAYDAGFNNVFAMIRQGNIKTTQEANTAIENYKDAIHRMEKASDDFSDDGMKRLQTVELNINGIKRIALIAMIVIVLISLISVFLSAYLIIRSINRPIGMAMEMSNAIAGGDLTVETDSSQGDEIGQMLHGMHVMVQRLKGSIEGINSDSDKLVHNSETLNSTSAHMSHSISEQTQKTEQIATSSTEMSQTVMDIAKNASDIASKAIETLDIAKSGKFTVHKSIDGARVVASTVGESAAKISSLGQRSKQIGEIINVINEIAEQTNLLALNAAIEAARAGEQGRGFAVVADEVRKLAERTAKATSEISSMIKAIQDETTQAVISMEDVSRKVDSGVELSTKAGDTLDKIVESIASLQEMVAHIASATEEMSTTSEQVNHDITSVANFSKENSDYATMISSTASELLTLSGDLKQAINYFKLGQRPSVPHKALLA